MIILDKVLSLCDAYETATGVPAHVLDEKGRVVSNVSQIQTRKFCSTIHDECRKSEECRRSHLYGSYQAERFGEAYVFFCPFGLVHWAAPIVEDNRIVYSIIVGPVLMSSPENALIDEILMRQGLNHHQISKLARSLHNVTFLQPEKVSKLAKLLFAVSSHLSGSDSSSLRDRKVFFDQQSDIGQVISENKRTKSSTYPLDKEKTLLTKIRLGDKAGAQKLLNAIFGHIFFSEGHDIESIRTRVIELVVLLSRAAMEGGADDQVIFGLNYDYLREIDNLGTVDEIAFWLSQVMTRFTECVFNLANAKNIDIIYKAVTYLRENYMNDVSLESIADEVNLSPTYFSKLFKEEMKTNFRSYLNNLRIEMSKGLVFDDSIPLVEVAARVGFQDQSYFSKVFKKITGSSPGEYRKTRGCN